MDIPSENDKQEKEMRKEVVESLTVIKFDSKTTVSYEQEECSVCLGALKRTQEIRILPCNHVFHKKCSDPWLLTNLTCPKCRYVLTKEEPVVEK